MCIYKCTSRAAIIFLKRKIASTALGSFSPELSPLCLCAFSVIFCGSFGEEEDVNCLRVFEWIKESFDTPVCEDDVFPTEGATKFIKVFTTHFVMVHIIITQSLSGY